jgi:2'-5' RNA ligase
MPEESGNVRAFICIRLQPVLIEELGHLQRRLERALPKNAARWNSPEQIHLTLKFLGNVPRTELEDLQTALEHGCRGVTPFRLRSEGIGAFPSLRNPRIIWAGLHGDLEPLLTLQRQMDLATKRWSEEAETRPFRAHLTLARIKTPQPGVVRQIGDCLREAKFASAHSWRVEQIALMQSQLEPDGAVHRLMAAALLSGPGRPEVV